MHGFIVGRYKLDCYNYYYTTRMQNLQMLCVPVWNRMYPSCLIMVDYIRFPIAWMHTTREVLRKRREENFWSEGRD